MTWKLAVIAFVVTVAIADLRWRRIPRSLTVPAFFAGLVYQWSAGRLLDALAAAALGFAVGMALYALGAIAGGDAKLLPALGALLGFGLWTRAMELAIFAAAVMAILQVVRHRALRQTMHNMGEILSSLLRFGCREHAVLNVRNPSLIRSPFGVAAAVGTVIALLR